MAKLGGESWQARCLGEIGLQAAPALAAALKAQQADGSVYLALLGLKNIAAKSAAVRQAILPFLEHEQAAFRGMKAEGGWGGICTEACSIDHQADTSPSVLASLWDEGDVINLRHMCDTLHKWGALAGVEL